MKEFRFWFLRTIYRRINARKVVHMEFNKPFPQGDFIRVSDYGYVSLGKGWFLYKKLT